MRKCLISNGYTTRKKNSSYAGRTDAIHRCLGEWHPVEQKRSITRALSSILIIAVQEQEGVTSSGGVFVLMDFTRTKG